MAEGASAPTKKTDTKRVRLSFLRSQLQQELGTFLPHWRDLGNFICPRRPRFSVQDVNKGDRRNQNIVDGTATQAWKTLRSGMQGGITSPARPWLRLTTPDPALAEFGPVKRWLHLTTQRMLFVFLRSNFYNQTPLVYGDMGGFGTAAMFLGDDLKDSIRCRTFPIGTYAIANDEDMRVAVFQRDFRLTVRQVIGKWGKLNPRTGSADWSNFSDFVKNCYDRGDYEQWVDICHIIQPNDLYDAKRSAFSKFKRFESCYFESGTSGAGTTGYLTSQDDDRYLSESGFDRNPILAPRWETNAEDVYGISCPAMDTLGDIRGLQTMTRKKAEAVERMLKPPMKGPTALRSQKTSIIPGDITFSDEREGTRGFMPVYQIDPRINEIRMDIQDIRQIINSGFYVDLFRMISNLDRRDITATEIQARNEEKLVALAPVLEQLNQDFLDPAVDLTFDIMVKQNQVPPPPKELVGVPLKVEYESILAQAMKLIGITGVERFTQFVGQLSAVSGDTSVWDKVNKDQLIDVYGDMTSVPPTVIRTDDEVLEIRDSRNKAIAAKEASENLAQTAGAARDLSQTDLDKNSALSMLLDRARAGEVIPSQPEGAPSA